MNSPDLLLGKFYRSPLQFDLHDQRQYWHFFIFGADGVVNLITHDGAVPALELRLKEGSGIQKGSYVLDGSRLTVIIEPDYRFQGEVINRHSIRLMVEDDVGYFDVDAIYKLVEEGEATA